MEALLCYHRFAGAVNRESFILSLGGSHEDRAAVPGVFKVTNNLVVEK